MDSPSKSPALPDPFTDWITFAAGLDLKRLSDDELVDLIRCHERVREHPSAHSARDVMWRGPSASRSDSQLRIVQISRLHGAPGQRQNAA
jgi:hypothetical protein